MHGQHTTVRPSVRDHEHDPFNSAVTYLQHHAASEGLNVPEPGLGFHPKRTVTEDRDPVPRTSVTRDRERHLRAQARVRRQEAAELLQQSELGSVAYGIAVRVRSHGEPKANSGASTAELIDREGTKLASLDPSKLGVRHAGRRARRELAQAGGAPSIADLLGQRAADMAGDAAPLVCPILAAGHRDHGAPDRLSLDHIPVLSQSSGTRPSVARRPPLPRATAPAADPCHRPGR